MMDHIKWYVQQALKTKQYHINHVIGYIRTQNDAHTFAENIALVLCMPTWFGRVTKSGKP